MQKVFTFVQQPSNDNKNSDIFRQGGTNNDKSNSQLSSFDNCLSANSNRELRPERNLNDDQKMTASPFWKIMNKMGLKYGDQTGLNLNKLIRQKTKQRDAFDNDTNSDIDD